MDFASPYQKTEAGGLLQSGRLFMIAGVPIDLGQHASIEKSVLLRHNSQKVLNTVVQPACQ